MLIILAHKPKYILMKIILQRVSKANVIIDNKVNGAIDRGLLLLLGIESDDTDEDLDWMIRKVINMRIFSDKVGKMNLSLLDVNGGLLVISQFTLFASIKKGNRPSYIKAAKPEVAIPFYYLFCSIVREISQVKVETGIFGADMNVNLTNNGPVTIILDTKNKV